MYNFVTGPLAWFSFLVFFIGLFVRIVLYIKGLDSSLDRVTYGRNIFYGIRDAVRSVFCWLIPFGARSWRTHPGMTILVFIFHICVLLPTLFLEAHNMILKERWGFSFITIPDSVSDVMTIIVLLTALLLIFRRVRFDEVRILTTTSDYLLLLITVTPFLTGFLAYHQISNYPFWMIAHIISGEIMLIAIPFTKLSHCLLFFLTRAQLGMDYGIKRGGMKRKGVVW